MQKLILGRKNHITIVSAILIIIAYVSKLGFSKRTYSHMVTNNCLCFRSYTDCHPSVSSTQS